MVDLGGRVIDTPPFFRPNPPVIGELLTEMGLQDELFLTGKITVSGKEAGIEHLEKTVRHFWRGGRQIGAGMGSRVRLRVMGAVRA